MGEGLQPKLSPAAIDLIKAATPQPQTVISGLTAVPAVKPSAVPATKPTSEAVPSAKPRAQKESQAEVVNLVHMNLRVPPEIPIALVKASADRKVRKIRPSSQQEIVAEALTAWLSKNGYLKSE